MALLVPLVLAGWLPSVRLASALARDAVIETIRLAAKTAPADADAWTKKVAEPAIALDRAMKTLSNGWGRGLLGLTMTCWLAALAYFSNVCVPDNSLPRIRISLTQTGGRLNTHRNRTVSSMWFPDNLNGDRNYSILFTFSLSVVPLLLAMDLAHTSSACDACVALCHAWCSALLF